MERRVLLFMDQGFERAEDVLQAAGVTVNTIQANCGHKGDGELCHDGGIAAVGVLLCPVRMMIVACTYVHSCRDRVT